MKVHARAAHPVEYHATCLAGLRRVKPRWSEEESRLLAEKEAKLLACGSLGGINGNLHRLFPQRSLDAIKSHRRGATYKGFVLEYRQTLREGWSLHSSGVVPDTAPAAMNSNDPRLWDILAEKERDFSRSLRLNANAHFARLLPEIPRDMIKRARKTEGYKGVLTRMREGGLSPVIEQPVLVQPESAPLSKCSITVGNRDSWKLIAEAEIAVEGERCVNLAIRKLLPQVRHKTLVQIRKTDSYKSLLGEIRCQARAAGRKSVSPENRQRVLVGGT